MLNCYEFCVPSTSAALGGAACAGLVRTTLERVSEGEREGGRETERERKVEGRGERKEGEEEAYLRRGLNGFTICFGGTGSCIITCLLVHRLASTVSQLKRASHFPKGRHTNKTALFLRLPPS